MLTAQTFDLAIAKNIFSKHSILIVEDDLLILENFKLTLTQLFKNVYTATDGQSGLDMYNQHKNELSIVMADYNMPMMNGLDMFAKIRETDKKIALMLITGDMSKDLFIRALKVKLNEFVMKPAQLKTFLLLIYQILIAVEHEKTILKQKKDLDILFKLLGRHNLITKTDLKGNITYANDMFCEISGYCGDEVIGKPQNIVRHPDMPSSTFKEMWDTIQAGNIWSGRVKNKAKDGSAYVVNAMIMPIRDKNGEINGYISSRHVITDEVENSEKVSEFNKHLKKNVIDLKSEKIKIKNQLENEYQQKLQQEIDSRCRTYSELNDLLHEQLARAREKNAMLLSNLNLREKELYDISHKQESLFKSHKDKTIQETQKAQAIGKELDKTNEEFTHLKLKYEELHHVYEFNLNELTKANNRIKELEDVIYHYDMDKKIQRTNTPPQE